MLIKQFSIAAVALTLGPLAFAQDYFDFGQIRGVPDRPAVQVDLNPMLLGIASQTVRSENPAAADLLASVDGVRVQVYTDLEDISDVVEFVEEVSSRLEQDDWQRVISVDDDGEIRVYVRGTDTIVTGITAMIVSDEDAIFVNLTGMLDADQLAQSIATMHGDTTLASLGDLDFGF
jgi:hypothetical protein